MRKHAYRQLIEAIALLAGVVYTALHYGELSRFIVLIRRIEPSWLFAALILQLGTYVSVALVWRRILLRAGVRYQLHRLVPLALAKLFADKAIPSGGISGIAFFFSALRRKGVPADICVRVVFIDILSYYAAYIIATTGALIVLWQHHDVRRWMVVVAAIFVAVAFIIPCVLLFLKKLGGSGRLPAWIARSSRTAPLVEILSNPSRPGEEEKKSGSVLYLEVTMYQTAVILLDSMTLWTMLRALGEPIPVYLVFPCLVIASMAALISPVPMGLGTFEALCVGLLIMFRIRFETALTATLLFRGLSLWLPMLPGLIVTRMKA